MMNTKTIDALAEVLKSDDVSFLKQVSKRAISRVNSLLTVEAIKAKAQFDVGDKVEFDSRKLGIRVTGVITKINTKNIVMKQDDGSFTSWNVSPSLLRKRG